MNVEKQRDLLHELTYTCTMNQLYHQRFAHWWWRWDKAVKITVGLLAVIALVAVYLPESPGWWIEPLSAWLAAIAAIVLNVVPVGEWESRHSELFRAWSDLGARANLLELKTSDLPENEPLNPILVDWYQSLAADRDRLDAQEPAANDELLKRCQEDVNEMRYGEGIRTTKQVEDYLARLRRDVMKPAQPDAQRQLARRISSLVVAAALSPAACTRVVLEPVVCASSSRPASLPIFWLFSCRRSSWPFAAAPTCLSVSASVEHEPADCTDAAAVATP